MKKIIISVAVSIAAFSFYLPSVFAATTHTSYIRPTGDCTGYSPCYNSLSAWEAGQQRDLVISDEIEVAQIGGSWTSADTTAVAINGWTTDATHYIRIYTTSAARHSGKWDTGKYRLEVASQWGKIINIGEDYVRIDGLQAQNTYTSDQPGGIHMNNSASTGGEFIISNNIIKFPSSFSSSYQAGISTNIAGSYVNSNSVVKIYNNIIYDASYGIAVGTGNGNLPAKYYVYNNTIIDSKNAGISAVHYGSSNPSSILKLKNNLVQGVNANFNIYQTTILGLYETSNNLSQDATSPDTSYRNKTVSFIDATNKDYHLASTDTGAKDFGTNLSADANLAFSDDIDGQTRSGTWDIGADEYISVVSDTQEPSIPTSLSATAISSSQINLSWTASTDNVGVTGYRIYKCQGTGCIPIQSATSATNSYSDTGLTANTSYSYTVAAYDAAGNVSGQSSPAVSATTQIVVVAPNATLTWNANTEPDLTGYKIYYGTSPRTGTNPSTCGLCGYTASVSVGNVLTYIFTNQLTIGLTYYFSISAYDTSNNESSFSGEVSKNITTSSTDTTPPVLSSGSPSGTLSSGTTQTTLGVSTNESATCRYSTASGVSYSSMTNTFSTTGLINHSTTVTGLSGGQSYNYYVRCQDTASVPNANATDYSISFSIASPADTVAPVISVISSSTTTDSATITFTTDEPADTQIEYGLTTSYGSTTTLNTTLVTTHSQNISGVSPNTTYNYRVITKDASNNTATSQNYTFITQSVADIQGPSTITDLSISNIGQTYLTLSWTVPSDTSGITIYDIRYSTSTITDANFNSATQVSQIPVPATSGTAQSQYVSVGLTPGTTYYFAIKSKDSLNNTSSISNIPSGTTQSAIIISSGGGGGGGGGGGAVSVVYQLSDTQSPSYPTDTKINSFSGQIALSWVNPADSDFIRVKILRKTDSYSTSPDDGTMVYDGNQTTFTDINLQNNQIYYYTMYAYDGVPNYSAPVKLLSVPLTALTQTAVIASQQPTSIIQYVFSKNLSLGIKNDESVKALQQILYLESVYPENIVSGNFGPVTQKAVIAFQKKHGISPASGFVGSLTRVKLNEIYGQKKKIISVSTPSQKLALTITLKRGSKLSQVKTLQEMLSKDKTIYPEQSATGYFGPATQKAVIRFQQKYNITPALGIVGPLTRAKMNEVYGK